MSYNIEIEVTPHFEQIVKRYKKKYRSFKSEISELIGQLYENHELGVDMGNGIRKIRLAIKSKNKGKSGGMRVITYTDIIV